MVKILAIVGAILIAFVLYRGIKGNPERFSKTNITKSFSTMGMLGLILIAFVALCIFFLQNS